MREFLRVFRCKEGVTVKVEAVHPCMAPSVPIPGPPPLSPGPKPPEHGAPLYPIEHGLAPGCRVEGFFGSGEATAGGEWYGGVIVEECDVGYVVRYDDGEIFPSLRGYLRLKPTFSYPPRVRMAAPCRVSSAVGSTSRPAPLLHTFIPLHTTIHKMYPSPRSHLACDGACPCNRCLDSNRQARTTP